MEYIDYIELFRKRLTELRVQKGVSSRDMSLSIGQCASYINKIENKRTLPSLTGFIYICEYFGVTPQEFFDVENRTPIQSNEIIKAFEKLTPTQAEHVLEIVKDLTEKK